MIEAGISLASPTEMSQFASIFRLEGQGETISQGSGPKQRRSPMFNRLIKTVGVCFVLFALRAASTGRVSAQTLQNPGQVPRQVPVVPQASRAPQFSSGSSCGLHQANDPNFVPLTVTATATGPFAIQLGWQPAATGDYTITTTDLQATVPHLQRSLAASRAVIVPRQTPQAPTPAAASRQISSGATYLHTPTLPKTQYNYVVSANLGNGKTACGSASAVSQPPPELTNVSAQYIDVRRVQLGFKLPPYVYETRVYRGPVSPATTVPANLAGDIVEPGRRFAGPDGQMLPSVNLDPGPPPPPYYNGFYNKGGTTYLFTVKLIWTAHPDGTGAQVTETFPIAVPGPPPIVGYADVHTHQVSYLGFGGDPVLYPMGRYFWGKAFGPIDTALAPCVAPNCRQAAAENAILQLAELGTAPAKNAHPEDGFPDFAGWPRWNNFIGQQYYQTWLQRAHLSGLKLIVVHPVNNAWMCTTLDHTSVADAGAVLASVLADVSVVLTGGATAPLATAAGLQATAVGANAAYYQFQRDPNCLDFGQSIHQIAEIKAMENFIDNSIGDGVGHKGPGTGWYHVVYTPQEARAVIAKGQLAVVIGMEVDAPFDCTTDSAFCNLSWVRAQLQTMYTLGMRHFFPIHFYNNAFGGSANSNFLITYALYPNKLAPIGCSYEYDNHKCNLQGLTALGKQLIPELMKKGMIIDIDHMSQMSFNDTLAIVSGKNSSILYPVVSGHAGFNALTKGAENNEGNRSYAQIQQIVKVGGMLSVIPHQGPATQMSVAPGSHVPNSCSNSSQQVANAYLYAVSNGGDAPVAFGTDFDGFAGWPGPRFGADKCMKDPAGFSGGPMLSYPYKIKATGVNISSTQLNPGPDIDSHGHAHPSIDAVGHTVAGQRIFDFNTDGLAQIGLLPDMIADWQAMGMTPAQLDPLFGSAEEYIRLWERAVYLSQTPAVQALQ